VLKVHNGDATTGHTWQPVIIFWKAVQTWQKQTVVKC